MKVGRAHLTYCTNIHPGESWAEVRANLEHHVVAVKQRVSPHAPFGVGLRLSAQAARECDVAGLKGFLAAHDLYVFTINGFPYGPFHGRAVKDDVYRPDWLEDERLAYTNQLADILAALLPAGVDGSISTVPGCFKPRAAPGVATRMIEHADYLEELEQRTGKRIMLALEPEPCCLLETIAETVELFTTELAGVRDRIGICLDACHAAVEFEDLRAGITALRTAGIAIPKVQLSAGLQIKPVDAAARRALAPYDDAVYLHQVVARRAGTLARYVDLPDALASGDADEWRIHFHVPVFRAELGPFASTQAFLAELLALHRETPLSTHLEVETYTWDVLPPEFRDEPIADAVARELSWVLERLR